MTHFNKLYAKNLNIKYSKLSTPIVPKEDFLRKKAFLGHHTKETERLYIQLLFEDLNAKLRFLLIRQTIIRTRILLSRSCSNFQNTCKNIWVNEDLCETLNLAHDLGHISFGHTGGTL